MGAVTRQIVILFGATLFAGAAESETVYYAVYAGKNFEKETWQTGDLKKFQASRPENVFDFYTFQRLADGKSKVVRERSTPSGDWFLVLTYDYSREGQLTKVDYDFHTFNGVCPCGETGPVRCQRIYTVSRSGKLIKASERITDLKSGNAVDWTFFEPTTRHWATLRELPIKPH